MTSFPEILSDALMASVSLMTRTPNTVNLWHISAPIHTTRCMAKAVDAYGVCADRRVRRLEADDKRLELLEMA